MDKGLAAKKMAKERLIYHQYIEITLQPLQPNTCEPTSLEGDPSRVSLNCGLEKPNVSWFIITISYYDNFNSTCCSVARQ